MPTLIAPWWRRFALRFVIAAAALIAAVVITRALAGVVPHHIEMMLAGGLAILVPGWAIAGALALGDDRGPVTAWGLVPLLGVVAWAVPGLIGLLVGLPLVVVGGVVLVGAALCLAARPPLTAPPVVDSITIVVLGAVGAVLGWQWQSVLVGDALFHAGVIRKLIALSRPTERNIWPFLDGHPHAGYAFPLLHLPEAAAIRISGLDVAIGYVDLVPLFGLMLPIVAYAVGSRVAGRLAGVVTVILSLWLAITGVQALSTAQQPRYFVTLVALPALLLLLLEQQAWRSRVIEALVVATVLVITVLHLTYVPPLLIGLVVVAAFNPELWRATIASTIASLIAVAIIYLTAVHGSGPSAPVPVPDGGFVTAGGHRIVLSGSQVFNHRAEAVLALVAAIWAVRRPRTPLGMLALLTAVIYLICTIPGVTTAFSAVVGQGQAVRYWEMLPWPYVLGPAIVLVARSRNAVIVIGVAAIVSLVLERTHLLFGNTATAISSLGALVLIASVVQAIARSRRRRRPSHGYNEGRGTAASFGLALALAVAVLIGSISEHAHVVSASAIYGKGQPNTVDQPTPGVLRYFRSRGGPLPVVLAPFGARWSNWYSGIAYELVGEAPVYAAAISGFHTESERRDQPSRRRRDVAQFLRPGTSPVVRQAIMARWHVSDVAIDLKHASRRLVRELDADPALRRVYTDPPQSDDKFARIAVWRAA